MTLAIKLLRQVGGWTWSSTCATLEVGDLLYFFPVDSTLEETLIQYPSEMPLAIPHFRGQGLLPQPSRSIRWAAGLVQEVAQWTAFPFPFDPFPGLESPVHGPPDYTKAHQTVGHPEVLPLHKSQSPHIETRETGPTGFIRLWTTSAGSPNLLLSSQHHISKVLPFLVTWLQTGQGVHPIWPFLCSLCPILIEARVIMNFK